MIFGSQWSICFLASCSLWHSDGTFTVRPLLFQQLYIIFGFNNGYMIPCAYSLTTKKNAIVYSKILIHLIELGKKFNVTMNPERLTCDFEQATISSFNDVSPNIKINGCFVHYAQSLWRKIQEIGMSRYFLQKKDNDNISDVKRKQADHGFLGAIGLALIPADIVESTWVDIIDLHTPDYAGAVTFNDYLVQTYVDRDVSLFEIETWNANNAILNDLPRTNNHVEGYNSRLE
ncbi:unnamed protein product, partial [Didymodactylos carnosus]